jgi:hypothetical protein
MTMYVHGGILAVRFLSMRSPAEVCNAVGEIVDVVAESESCSDVKLISPWEQARLGLGRLDIFMELLGLSHDGRCSGRLNIAIEVSGQSRRRLWRLKHYVTEMPFLSLGCTIERASNVNDLPMFLDLLLREDAVHALGVRPTNGDGWEYIRGKEPCVYFMTKVLRDRNLSRRVFRGQDSFRHTYQAPGFIRELYSTLTQIDEVVQVVEIGLEDSHTEKWLRRMDERLLSEWGHLRFKRNLNTLGVSLEQWLASV